MYLNIPNSILRIWDFLLRPPDASWRIWHQQYGPPHSSKWSYGPPINVVRHGYLGLFTPRSGVNGPYLQTKLVLFISEFFPIESIYVGYIYLHGNHEHQPFMCPPGNKHNPSLGKVPAIEGDM